MDLNKFTKKNWKNENFDSPVPDICKTEPCILGIDEAGRGPVLGPMVYSVSYCPKSWEEDLKSLGAADSKTLTEEKRDDLLKLIIENEKFIGWSLEVISPMYISNCMYEVHGFPEGYCITRPFDNPAEDLEIGQEFSPSEFLPTLWALRTVVHTHNGLSILRNKVSLNEISQNSAAQLIRRVLGFNVKVSEVYVDTVGDPLKYQARLEEQFPGISITVSKKADSIYPIVSAASIVAKVARDKALSSWEFPESIDAGPWGSGYPGDNVTKNFLVSGLDCIFGFPGLVRFSWSTAEKILEEKGVKVKWLHEDVKEEETPSVLDFFVKKRKKGNQEDEPKLETPVPKKRHFYFESRNLKRISTL